jgi:Arc/MetJ-type ribon-helix-helix transcriptional regulator
MKRKPDKELVLSVRMTESLLTEIDDEVPLLAEERGEKVTRSNAIRYLLRTALKSRQKSRI